MFVHWSFKDSIECREQRYRAIIIGAGIMTSNDDVKRNPAIRTWVSLILYKKARAINYHNAISLSGWILRKKHVIVITQKLCSVIQEDGQRYSIVTTRKKTIFKTLLRNSTRWPCLVIMIILVISDLIFSCGKATVGTSRILDITKPFKYLNN